MNRERSLLGDVPLFAALESEEIDAIAATMQVAEYAPGRIIFREGDRGDTLFVIEQGKVELYLINDRRNRIVVNTLGYGDTFGELSLFDEGVHSVAARALEPTRVYTLNKRNLTRLIKSQPELAEGIIQGLVRRIRTTDAILRTTDTQNPNVIIDEQETIGIRLSDAIARFGGSWRFIISFMVVLIGWLLVNSYLFTRHPFDPYPYILLNLVLSMIAALQAPLIMMSQNRQDARDRLRSELDYQVNLRAELGVAELLTRLQGIETRLDQLQTQEVAAPATERVLPQPKDAEPEAGGLTAIDAHGPPIAIAAPVEERAAQRVVEAAPTSERAATTGIDAPAEQPPWYERLAARAHPRLASYAAAIAVLAIFAVATFAIHRELQSVSYGDIRTALGGFDWATLLWAMLFTSLSYAALIGYDWMGLWYIGRTLPLGTVARASLCTYAISNTVGLSALSGSAVRMRMYHGAGLDGTDIAKVSAFCLAGFAIGVQAIGAVALVTAPHTLATMLGLDPNVVRLLGSVAAAVLGGIICLGFVRTDPVTIAGWRIRLPHGWVTLGQVAVSVVDIVAAAMVLYLLLPPLQAGFAPFLLLFVVAAVSGVLSHVPGGVGVFEGVLLVGLRGQADGGSLMAGLLAFRFIYYLLPFVLATAWLVVHELALRRTGMIGRIRQVQQLGTQLVPGVLAAMTFVSGVILLWSSVSPSLSERMHWLSDFVPLAVLEVSRTLAAAVGVSLLLVARGLNRRLNGAAALAIGLSVAGAALAIAKGADYEEAVLLLLTAAMLWASREQFYRHTALLDSPLSLQSFVAIAGVIAGMLAIVLFSFKHVPYEHGLWLEFSQGAELPRALRALLAGASVLIAVSVLAMLRPPRFSPRPVTEDELAQATTILRWQDNPEANLVLMRDKQLMFADDGSAFLMYGVHGASWIALGDPVGAPAASGELAWRLREMADRAGGRVAFYQVAPENLSRYVDMGLVPFKLGEEASVNLTTFSLEGSSRKGLRQALSRGERDGLTMEVVQPPHADALIAQLRSVSDEWLKTRHAREKRFSLGAFNDDYVRAVPIAVVRRGEAIVAFASLMTTDTATEAAVDLMRHVDGAPGSTMLYLFVRLLGHFQSQGYRRFHLGMAPLSGMEDHPLASTWHRFGHLIYNRGERYYNFRGLRLFKEKFDPDWEPRYLVTQGGISPLLVMADLSALISGGIQGIVRQ